MNKQNLLHYPLSGQEMLELNPGALLVPYNELNNIFNIDDLFKNTNKIIILYLLQSRTAGHWVTLFKNQQGYNFFDSYGHLPDYQVDCLTQTERREFKEKQGKLMELLENKLIHYNDFEFQKPGSYVCGCYVSHRLNNHLMSTEVYCAELEKIRDPDLFVANYCLRKFNNKFLYI
jgi:hypothetical protein